MKKQIYKTKDTEIPQTKITFRIAEDLKNTVAAKLLAKGLTMTEFLIKALKKL
jgi:hypothetical protein